MYRQMKWQAMRRNEKVAVRKNRFTQAIVTSSYAMHVDAHKEQ
jgi:hypothetical protein